MDRINRVGSSSPVRNTEPSSVYKRPSVVKPSLISRILSLPDKHPRIAFAFDITILALAIISMVAILIVSQGQGILLFALIPGIVLGAFGIYMLVSDIGKHGSEKLKRVIDTVAAVVTPFLLLGIASCMLLAACALSGGGALLLIHPFFVMGMVTMGVSLITLNRVTYAHFRDRAIEESKKTKALSNEYFPDLNNRTKRRKTRREWEEAEARRELRLRAERANKRLTRAEKSSQGTFSSSSFSSSSSSDSDYETARTSLSTTINGSYSGSYHTPSSSANSSSSASTTAAVGAITTTSSGAGGVGSSSSNCSVRSISKSDKSKKDSEKNKEESKDGKKKKLKKKKERDEHRKAMKRRQAKK